MLARHAPDLGTALRHVVLYLHLHDRGAVPCLWECGDRAILAYTIHQPDVPGTEHIYDAAIAIVYGILKSLAGPGWEADEVRLFRPRPGDVEPYRQQFRTRLSFGASHAAVVFGAGWLARPLGGADALLHARIMQEIQALESQGAGDLIAQLRRVLRRLLIGGRAPGETSLERISKVFAIHRRTLNRRLRERGTSFKALVEEARYDIARQLLRDTRLPVAEVAGALDYADAAAFTRAFRRWSGSTPAAWRAARAAG
jgi:AraC-like DNA-binding protein